MFDNTKLAVPTWFSLNCILCEFGVSEFTFPTKCFENISELF